MGSDDCSCCGFDKFDFVRFFFGILTLFLLAPGVYLLVEGREKFGIIAAVVVGAAFIFLGIFGVCAAIFKHKGLVSWYIGITILYEFFTIAAVILIAVYDGYRWENLLIAPIAAFVYLVITVTLAVEYRRDPLRLV